MNTDQNEAHCEGCNRLVFTNVHVCQNKKFRPQPISMMAEIREIRSALDRIEKKLDKK